MSRNYGANKYKQTSITTANRGQLLLMLYEAAVKYTKAAIECINKGDIAGRGMAIGKVHDIINELLNTLDHEVGGDVARDLDRLYNFMIEQLIQANMDNAKEPLVTTQKLLETLLEGWRGAVAQVNQSGEVKG